MAKDAGKMFNAWVRRPRGLKADDKEAKLKEIKGLLLPRTRPRCGVANEFWPGLYIGDMNIAQQYEELHRRGFTHILNCVDKFDRNTYKCRGFTYLGIRTYDVETYGISGHFDRAAEFIHTALSKGGKVLVHCWAGVSRSATIVLAYLMLKQNMTLVEAVKMAKEKRGILPNDGFLRQLLDLQTKLKAE